MTISTSMSKVGVVRAAEMILSARNAAALDHERGLHTVSVEIPRLSDTLELARDAGRPLPDSQKRTIDISV
jgi:hypothetical protein